MLDNINNMKKYIKPVIYFLINIIILALGITFFQSQYIEFLSMKAEIENRKIILETFLLEQKETIKNSAVNLDKNLELMEKSIAQTNNVMEELKNQKEQIQTVKEKINHFGNMNLNDLKNMDINDIRKNIDIKEVNVSGSYSSYDSWLKPVLMPVLISLVTSIVSIAISYFVKAGLLHLFHLHFDNIIGLLPIQVISIFQQVQTLIFTEELYGNSVEGKITFRNNKVVEFLIKLKGDENFGTLEHFITKVAANIPLTEKEIDQGVKLLTRS